MIHEYKAKAYCCEDISLIENYEAALADKTQTWDCHHKLEMFMTKKELIATERYYNVPARELVFLTRKEHFWWPHKGREEAREKISAARFGMKFSDEHKEKIRAAHLGKKFSDEARQKMSAAKCGMKFWNNGIKNIRAKTCPDGFVAGRLTTKQEHRQ